MSFSMPRDGGFVARGGWVAYHLAQEFGLTLVQACGIVGNLGFESAGFTHLHEIGQPEGKGGYGWAQWTASRRVSFMAFCDQKGLDWRSDEANYGYLCEDLDGPYNSCLGALDDADTLEKAVFSFGQTFERPGGTTPNHLPGFDGRLSYARKALVGAQALELAHPLVAVAPVVPRHSFLDRLKKGLGLAAVLFALLAGSASAACYPAPVWPGWTEVFGVSTCYPEKPQCFVKFIDPVLGLQLRFIGDCP